MIEGLDESHNDYRCEENSVLVATECHRRSFPAKSVLRDRGLPWTNGIYLIAPPRLSSSLLIRHFSNAKMYCLFILFSLFFGCQFIQLRTFLLKTGKAVYWTLVQLPRMGHLVPVLGFP